MSTHLLTTPCDRVRILTPAGHKITVRLLLGAGLIEVESPPAVTIEEVNEMPPLLDAPWEDLGLIITDLDDDGKGGGE